MTEVAERHETYTADFETFRREPGFGPDWLRTVRDIEFSRFLDAGFPTTRLEEWRHTNVAPIARTAFSRAPEIVLDRHAVEPLFVSEACARVVIVNGRVSVPLSSLDRLPKGLTIRSFREVLASGARAEDLPIGALAKSGSAFVSLNTAFFEDGVLVDVAAGTIVPDPVQVLIVNSGGFTPVMTSPRLMVVLGERAELRLVETYASTGTGTALTNTVTEIAAGPGAVLDHTRVQYESATAFHVSGLFVDCARASTVTSHALTFGARIARNDIVATLDGEGAECTLNGLYIAADDALVDTHSTIDHARAHCPSHELYKGILAGRARAVFNGKIIVRPDAQKTDAKQTNKALLLTDDAQINTKPQLEIFADDVKCTHGAAIGQLDEDALFYLRARGISEPAARHLLIEAFAGDVLDRLKVPSVRAWAQRVMEEKLAGAGADGT